MIMDKNNWNIAPSRRAKKKQEKEMEKMENTGKFNVYLHNSYAAPSVVG